MIRPLSSRVHRYESRVAMAARFRRLRESSVTKLLLIWASPFHTSKTGHWPLGSGAARLEGVSVSILPRKMANATMVQLYHLHREIYLHM